MPKREARNPTSAKGEWFIDDRCIDCAASREVASGLIVERGGKSVWSSAASPGEHCDSGQMSTIRIDGILCAPCLSSVNEEAIPAAFRCNSPPTRKWARASTWANEAGGCDADGTAHSAIRFVLARRSKLGKA